METRGAQRRKPHKKITLLRPGNLPLPTQSVAKDSKTETSDPPRTLFNFKPANKKQKRSTKVSK